MEEEPKFAVALRGSTGTSFLKVVADCIGQRHQESEDDEKSGSAVHLKNRDMLSGFLEVSQTNESVPPW